MSRGKGFSDAPNIGHESSSGLIMNPYRSYSQKGELGCPKRSYFIQGSRLRNSRCSMWSESVVLIRDYVANISRVLPGLGAPEALVLNPLNAHTSPSLAFPLNAPSPSPPSLFLEEERSSSGGL